jgi:hypothetical protein
VGDKGRAEISEANCLGRWPRRILSSGLDDTFKVDFCLCYLAALYHSHTVGASTVHLCRLGGVMVSVLSIGPKVRGSNPAEAMDF